MRVRVFYHSKCFDGACSAALFSRFYRERIREDVQFQYTGLVHRAGALFDEAKFDGDENAIVDFKYSSSPKITWWFDHHLSAFLTPEDAAHYESDASTKKFYDPDFKSCTKFIATVAEKRFGFNPVPVAELVEWADIIDGALYPDATTAVEMKHPAMKLTMVIESTQDPEFIPRLIPLLASMPLDKIIQQPFVADLLPPLFRRHEQSIRVLRERAECKEGTLFFDITDQDLEGYNKFIPYYLHPACIYSVGLSKSSFRTKVAVGSNPWARPDNMVNLARICERYGGGGHARVGAISFEPDKFDVARKAAREIVDELRASYRDTLSSPPPNSQPQVGRIDNALFQNVAAQMMAADQVEFAGAVLPVRRTSGQRLKTVAFNSGGHKYQAIEQNPDKPSRWGQFASSGHQVVQFMSEATNRFVAVSVDGKLTLYGGGAKGATR